MSPHLSDRFRTGGALHGRLTQSLLGPAPPSFQPGAQLGVWRLERLLGRGGMSEVYLASRTAASFQQSVALKIVAAGPELSERLREERRMLARLKHEGIAGLIDGGELDDGRAWFAMEFVEGQRLDDYVVNRHLDWTSRIELFEALCAAVMHAHAHLLVHRDIKPANVMVDEQGRLRLLDFGIAVPAQETRDSMDRYMTPGFAAPEQLEGGEITTATDIYQLGETLRRITLGSADCNLLAMPGPVHAGLQAIIACATAPVPSQRYDGVARLREDLVALRQLRPVRALGGGQGYRAGLLMRRHPRSAALVALLLLLALGAAASLARSLSREAEERRVALREEHTAGAIGNFFVELFHDPVIGDGGVAGLLDRGQQRLLANQREAPETRAALLHALAMANVRLERPETARTLLREAIATQTRLGELAVAELALSQASLARIEFLSGDSVSGLQRAARAQSLLAAPGAPQSHSFFLALVELGELHVNALQFTAADSLLESALTLGIRRYGTDSPQLFNVRRLQVESLRNQWQVERVLPLSEALVAECERRFGADDAACIVETTNLARLHSYAGEFQRAEQTLRLLLAKSGDWTGKRRVYRIHAALYDLAEGLWLQGRYPEARSTLEQSLDKLAEAEGGSSGPHWEADRGALALLLLDMGLAQQAWDVNSTRQRPTPDKPAVVEDHFWIMRQTQMELALGQVDARTGPALAAAVQALSATYGEHSYFASRAWLVQAQLSFANGQFDAAQAALRQVRLCKPQGLRVHHAKLLAEAELLQAQLAAKQGDSPGAERSYRATLAHLPGDLYPDSHPLRASLQAQILLDRTEPLPAPEMRQLEQTLVALRQAHHPDSSLLKAIQRRVQQETRSSSGTPTPSTATAPRVTWSAPQPT